MKSPWPTKKLGEICDFIHGFSFKADDFNEKGLGIPVIRTGDLNNLRRTEKFYSGPYQKDYLVDFGDVLIGLSGTIISGVWKGTKALLNQRVVKLINFKEADKKFVGYILPLSLSKLSEEISRSAVKNVLKHHLESLEIPLPLLPTQQKTVKILDTIQSAVEIQEKIIEKTKELKKSLMAELFKYGAPSCRKGRKLKKTEIGEIPENWEVVRLEEVCDFLNGYAFKTSDYTNDPNDFVVVRMSNITKDGSFDLSAGRVKYFLKERINEVKQYLLKKNDLVIAMTDMSKEMGIVGHTAIVDLDDRYLLNQRVGKIIPNNKVNVFYLHIYTNTPQFIEYIKSTCSGSIQMNTSTSAIKNALLPLPPLPEQREIAETLQTIDQKIEIEQKKKGLYEELFRTMLNKIMSQEVDVEKIEL